MLAAAQSHNPHCDSQACVQEIPQNITPRTKKVASHMNLHQIGKLPHRSFRDLAKKYGPLVHLQLGQMSYIIVSSKELAKEVMKTHDTIFASRPKLVAGEIFNYGSTNIAFAPYGNYILEAIEKDLYHGAIVYE